MASAGRQGSHLRVPAHRARRRLGPGAAGHVATPTEDGTGYVLNGHKLWATNGAIADIVVVMAHGPRARRRTGAASPRSCCPTTARASPSSTATRSWGCAGSRTRSPGLTMCSCPNENVIGKEGHGLKIALTTLNTGRLALPAICVGVTKCRLSRAREWSGRTRPVGHPIGKHDAVAQKLASSLPVVRDGGDGRRLEPAGGRQAERHPDRGGAREALRLRDRLAGGRRDGAGPRRPRLRDRRVASRPAARSRSRPSRCCVTCGSTGSSRDRREIMHLLIAREAVDQHLQVAGDSSSRRRRLGDKAKTRRQGRQVLRELAAEARGRPGHEPTLLPEFGSLARAPALRRAQLPQARALDVLRHEPLAGEAREKQSFLGRIVDIGAELYAIASSVVYADTIAREHPDRRRAAYELADLFCMPGPPPRRRAVHGAVVQRRRRQLRERAEAARWPLHVAREWSSLTDGTP